jgi:hypothetical protein
MSTKWKIKYSTAAILTAVAIISIALIANPTMLPQTVSAASFTVMLTDPPNVPDGTTLLDLNYSDVSLHVTYPNGTIEWLPVGSSGNVNLLSLINMTETIASTTIPVGSAIDKIQFTIADVETVVKGELYNVTALSNTLVVNVANGNVNQALSGVLIDFNPTLVQIKAADANGALVHYYVLVPSATATVVDNLDKEQVHVGTVVKLNDDDCKELEKTRREFSNNIQVVSASLKVNDDVTSISVTLKNEGTSEARIFGLTLNGNFNSAATWQSSEDDKDDKVDEKEEIAENIHIETVPFKVSSSSLTPLFSTDDDYNEEFEYDDYEHADLSAFNLQPGQSITVSFSGVIVLQPEDDDKGYSAIVVTPRVDVNYTLRLMGEGFQTFTVKASS